MRWTAPLLLILIASGGAAQTVEPDTLDPARYAPLHVGDRWEYERRGGPDPGPTWLRRTVVGDTIIDGERWVIQREQGFRRVTYPESGRVVWTRTEDARRYYRFDPDLANVLAWDGREGVPIYPCRLDLPVTHVGRDGPRGARSCANPEERRDEAGGRDPAYVKNVVVDEDGSVTASVTFEDLFTSGPDLALDVGEVRSARGEGPSEYVLAYADVGGEAQGVPVEGMPYVPDLTPPASYYPLGVGDQWVYSWRNPTLVGHRRRAVTRDTVVDGRTYAVVEYAEYDERAAVPEWDVTGTALLRFDPETTDVVGLGSDGEYVHISDLGADFLGCRSPSRSDESCLWFFVDGTYPGRSQAVFIGGEAVQVSSIKVSGGIADPGPPGYAAGIGELALGYASIEFAYARVGGVEYGSHPVSTTDRPAPPAFALAAGPSPTAGPLILHLDLPAPADVTAEAFDVLGRRVWRTAAALGAGRQTLALDAGPWAPGLYVVRVVAGGAARTATVVRR